MMKELIVGPKDTPSPIRKVNDGHPKWPAFREHFRAVARGPEYQALPAKLQSAEGGWSGS